MKYYKIRGHYSGTVVTPHGPDPRGETEDPVEGEFEAEVIASSPEEAMSCVRDADYYKWDIEGVDKIFFDSIEEAGDSDIDGPSLEIFNQL